MAFFNRSWLSQGWFLVALVVVLLGFGVLVILSVIAFLAVQLILNALLVDLPWPSSLAPEWAVLVGLGRGCQLGPLRPCCLGRARVCW